MTSGKPRVGVAIERLEFPTVDQEGSISVGQSKERWTMLFVYRGRHCPRCKRFLNKLNDALPDWVAAMASMPNSAWVPRAGIRLCGPQGAGQVR